MRGSKQERTAHHYRIVRLRHTKQRVNSQGIHWATSQRLLFASTFVDLLLCEFATEGDALHRACFSARQLMSAALGSPGWLLLGPASMPGRGWLMRVSLWPLSCVPRPKRMRAVAVCCHEPTMAQEHTRVCLCVRANRCLREQPATAKC